MTRPLYTFALLASFPLMLAAAFALRFDTPIWTAIASAYRNGGL